MIQLNYNSALTAGAMTVAPRQRGIPSAGLFLTTGDQSNARAN